MDASNPVATALRTALIARANAEIADGKARMMIYFSSAVGIGEHPQHTEEMDKILDQIAAAQDRLDALDKHFPA